MRGKDYPDWGGYPVSGQAYPLKDMAELAVRLGSVVVFDRAGAVAFIEDWEYGVGRTTMQSDVGATDGVIVNAPFWSKGYSLQLDPGTTADRVSQAMWQRPPLPNSLWGLSAMFSTARLVGAVRLLLAHATGGDYYTYELKVDVLNRKLQVLELGGGYADVASITYHSIDTKFFHFFKMVFDPINHTYSRVVFDGKSYTGIDTKPDFTTGTVIDQISFSIAAISGGAAMLPVHADNVILTYNES